MERHLLKKSLGVFVRSQREREPFVVGKLAPSIAQKRPRLVIAALRKYGKKKPRRRLRLVGGRRRGKVVTIERLCVSKTSQTHHAVRGAEREDRLGRGVGSVWEREVVPA